MQFCSQCLLPDSRPNLVLNESGVCNACVNHNSKEVVDWDARKRLFEDVVLHAKRKNGYDCIIPVSGGKDSHWQVLTCLEYGLNPLAVTWKTPGRTSIGQENLNNLVSLGVDHIDYQINPDVEARFMLRAFEEFGATAVPMHMAMFHIPLTLAHRFDIPLVVWGENSAAEYGSEDEEHTGFKLDSAWIKKYGVTHGTTAADWIERGFTEKEMTPYFGPSDAEMAKADIRAVFLGYYFEWDPEMTKNVAVKHGFKPDRNGPKTGLYDYADIDDDYISIHHWMKWYKFGFTRLFDNLSLEIRNRRMTRDEAIEVAQKIGLQKPVEDIRKFCDLTGISLKRFDAIAETFRNNDVWTQSHGQWVIENFPIPDWSW